MYGLEAITRANGWQIAFVGCFIVFFGLCLLSFLISQLHYILVLFEKIKNDITKKKNVKEISNSVKVNFFEDIDTISNIYMSFSKQLGSKFKLSDLYRLARDNGFISPHISIRNFRNCEILVPLGDGYFSWKKNN